MTAICCSTCTRARNLTIKPCACMNCRATDKRHCEECSRICLGCGEIYCEKTALEVLAENHLPADAPFRCENCQFSHDEALLEKFTPQMELGLHLVGRTA